jgi:DNA-directed RNA polymerase subunit RPC12/RpoP
MSALSVRCSGCHRRLAVPPRAAGRAVRCPHCRATVAVPADDSPTVVDESAPDFSYLRNQSAGDDILTPHEPDDQESAISEGSAPRPDPPPEKPKSLPPTVVYIPPAAIPAQPRAGLTVRPAQPSQPTRPDRPGTPAWVWPALIGLAIYAAAATGVGAWGWLRPAAVAPPSNPAR